MTGRQFALHLWWSLWQVGQQMLTNQFNHGCGSTKATVGPPLWACNGRPQWRAPKTLPRPGWDASMDPNSRHRKRVFSQQALMPARNPTRSHGCVPPLQQGRQIARPHQPAHRLWLRDFSDRKQRRKQNDVTAELHPKETVSLELLPDPRLEATSYPERSEHQTDSKRCVSYDHRWRQAQLRRRPGPPELPDCDERSR